MEATIKFKNQTEMVALQNGDCFILGEKPDFPTDLSEVTIEEEFGTKVMHNVRVQDCASVDGNYWFAFIEESEQEIAMRELQEQNDILTECILEMSEIIYGE